MNRFVRALTLAVAPLILAVPSARAQAPEWTLLIRGGTVVDGTGAARYAADIAVRDDTQQLVEVGLLAWFFLTPIIYPLEALSPSLQLILQMLNPVASLIGAYRHILFLGDAPNLMLLGVTALQALLALVVGALVFRRLSPSFAEEV